MPRIGLSPPKSRARLISDGAGVAGIEIELAPGAITYWRDPGESGLPPTFALGASQNIATAEVLYPAPSRILEPDGTSANGYRDKVIFPVRFSKTSSDRPAILNVNANYAVCEKICLPAHANFSLELPAGSSGPYDDELAGALAQVPQNKSLRELDGEVTSSGEKRWRLCLPAQLDAPSELFVEGPRGAVIESMRSEAVASRECFLLSLLDPPLDASAPLSVVATLTGRNGAKETSFALPMQ